ncbi:hypothetical protein HHI36_014853, partial [Cryptolaemus montrouzieri]
NGFKFVKTYKKVETDREVTEVCIESYEFSDDQKDEYDELSGDEDSSSDSESPNIQKLFGPAKSCNENSSIGMPNRIRADGGIRRSDSESSDDNISIAQLRPSKNYYGRNRYKWATEPPSRRVRTPQHNIMLNRSILHLTEDEKKDPTSIWNKLSMLIEMRRTISTWTNFKIAEFRAKYKVRIKRNGHDRTQCLLKIIILLCRPKFKSRIYQTYVWYGCYRL